MKIVLTCALLAVLINASYAAVGVRSNARKWPDKAVFYDFHSTLTTQDKRDIRSAIQRFAEETCLRFIQSSNAKNRILFLSKAVKCYKEEVGFMGGVQRLNIRRNCAGDVSDDKARIIHKIGHGIGLFDQHVHPQRTSYIKLYLNNVSDKYKKQFKAQSWKKVDTYGIRYDYHSIMHHGSFFLSRNGKKTINASRPLGTATDLSSADINTINRMYYCPAEGLKGSLAITILEGKDFPNKDSCCFNSKKPDSYVRIEAVRADGRRTVRRTNIVSNDNTPVWNKRYQFVPGSYMFYRISVLDSDDLSGDDVIIYDQLVTVRPGTMNNVLCASPGNCAHKLTFKSEFIPDRNECDPNPCQNGGTCIDNISDFWCECARGWFGRNCEFPYGEMTVEVVKGHNLPDRDGFLAGKSDPYVEVRAFNANGYANGYLRSPTIEGNHNPVWNYERSLGTRTFSGKIEVTVMDEDTTSGDDTLIPRNTFDLGLPVRPGTAPRLIRSCDSALCERFVELKVSYVQKQFP